MSLHNPNSDGASIAPLEEGVSSLRWSPTSNMLIATSWDGGCYLWDVKTAQHAEAKLKQSLEVCHTLDMVADIVLVVQPPISVANA
jgi:WD40 repeat protein